MEVSNFMPTLVLAAEHTPRKAHFHLSEDAAGLSQLMRESIARRAYELFEERQCQPGDDLADWLTAECDVTLPAAPVVTELDDRIDVQFDLDVLSGDDLEIAIQPLFRTVPLPVEVQPAATVTLIRDRLLRIALPKPITQKS